jgi:hypothetical protein
MTYTAKFKGPTNTRGSRIIVTDWNGEKSFHNWNHALNTPRNYFEAIKERHERDKATKQYYSGELTFFSGIDGAYVAGTCNEIEDIKP